MPKAVSENTRKAVEQAMQLNKNKRPQTVAEFLDILQQVGNTIVAPKLQAVQDSEATQLLAEVETVYEDKRMINGHDYVDLGLSVKWATCNVGANAPHKYGNYYAWGETETKSEYTSDNSRTYDKNMSDISGNATYDVARSNWGGSWRLPTKAEMEELKDKCTWTWTSQSGVKGYKVTGPNGNSIFLPAAGFSYGSSRYSVGEGGFYWSSTPDESVASNACVLHFYGGGHDEGWGLRNYGYTVRPVSE